MPDFSKMPEAFVSSAQLASAVSREVKAGRLRKLGSRLYTRNLKDPPEKIVYRNLWPLVATYLPGGLIGTSPLHRAIFMMFLVSEVHPFADGNGRAARIMMNTELVAAGENRIIVPTVYRSNYLMALKALSQNRVTGALVRVMDFSQRYTAAIDFSDFERARSILEETHAFADPSEAEAAGIRLVLPAPEVVADAPKQ